MVQHGQGVGGGKRPGQNLVGPYVVSVLLCLFFFSFIFLLLLFWFPSVHHILSHNCSPHNTDQHSTTRLKSGADTESQCCTVTAAAIKGNYIDIKRHTISFAVDKNDIKRTKALLHILAPISLSFQFFPHFSLKWFLPKWWLHVGKHFPRIIQDLRANAASLLHICFM